jgi:hypothetical protein
MCGRTTVGIGLRSLVSLGMYVGERDYGLLCPGYILADIAGLYPWYF